MIYLQEVKCGGDKHKMRNKWFAVFVMMSLLSGRWSVARLDDKEMYYSNVLSTRAQTSDDEEICMLLS